MELEIRTNAATAAAMLGRKSSDIERAAARATRAAGKAVYDVDRKEVNVIYARAIPKRKSGKPMWKRKGTLRRGELLSFPNPLQAIISNDTPYAVARHELNRPGAGGVTRHDPWRRKTVEKAGEEAGRTFERVFTEEMNK